MSESISALLAEKCAFDAPEVASTALQRRLQSKTEGCYEVAEMLSGFGAWLVLISAYSVKRNKYALTKMPRFCLHRNLFLVNE
ncbi:MULTISPECIES: hypothetical protein [Ochrobactrum]|uniref:hypothetical protein n=1 Tax=Ochrobactrum TaxID=528 RepID=UPI001F377D60|nr:MULTISPECIES: hypothetical protein [Brucella]